MLYAQTPERRVAVVNGKGETRYKPERILHDGSLWRDVLGAELSEVLIAQAWDDVVHGRQNDGMLDVSGGKNEANRRSRSAAV